MRNERNSKCNPHARKCQSESKNQIDKGLEDTTLWIMKIQIRIQRDIH